MPRLQSDVSREVFRVLKENGGWMTSYQVAAIVQDEGNIPPERAARAFEVHREEDAEGHRKVELGYRIMVSQRLSNLALDNVIRRRNPRQPSEYSVHPEDSQIPAANGTDRTEGSSG